MTCYSLGGITPVIDPSAYVHPTAVLIGDVIVGPGCYVGPCASLRGDFGRIVLEEGANLQDTCVMHGFPGGDTVIERNGHVGHGAVLHGCRVGEDALIGMNAVVMDGAHVAPRCIVAATAFVKAGFECAEQSLVVGSPAQVKRPLTDQELAWKQRGTPDYIEDILAGVEEAGSGFESGGGGGEEDAETDALYDEAVQFVLESRRASISAVQRKLKIGYNRAARMIEAMEMAGVVTSMNTNGSREVLAPSPARD